MDLMRSERNDRETARALGIRAAQEGCQVTALDSPEMLNLCAEYSARGIKMLSNAWLRGWTAHRAVDPI